MKRMFSVLLLTILVVSLSSCAPASGGNTIKIGLQAPLTGSFAAEGQRIRQLGRFCLASSSFQTLHPEPAAGE